MASLPRYLRGLLERTGALVAGRRLFDICGWVETGQPFGDMPVFVVTHAVPAGWPGEDMLITFVTDGVESAVEQAKAVGGANIAQQCLDAGLLDEMRVNLVPLLIGEGIRYFDNLSDRRSPWRDRASSRGLALPISSTAPGNRPEHPGRFTTCVAWRERSGRTPRCLPVPPAGLEPAHPAPEAGALSAELRGLKASLATDLPSPSHCPGPAAIVQRWTKPRGRGSSWWTTIPSSFVSSR
jgi:dihydrofolate reductase